jgi:hypothetical protein
VPKNRTDLDPYTASTEMMTNVQNYTGTFVLVATIAIISYFWSDVSRSWLHPELLAIGEKVGDQTFPLRLIFNWQLFDANPHRLRIVSDLFEIIDASSRPYIARLAIFHPTLSVTLLLFVLIVPTAVFFTLRLWSFSVLEALLLVALLLSTPGFLSLCFAYIRPAKPIAFVVLSLGLLMATKYMFNGRRTTLVGLWLLLLMGMFTDEILFWLPFVVAATIILTRQLRPTRHIIWALTAVFAFYALSIKIILPPLYARFGDAGPRTIAAIHSQTGDHPITRMFGYLATSDFLWTSLTMVGRSFLANLGMFHPGSLAIAFMSMLLMVAVIGVVATLRFRDQMIWQFSAIVLFGLLSFSIFATWLDWYNFPHSNEDFGALNYYYHSPVSLFSVLAIGCGLRLVYMWANRPGVAYTVGFVSIVLVSAAIANNVAHFLVLNDVVRTMHLGSTDSAAFFVAARNRHVQALGPKVIVTNDSNRFNDMLARQEHQLRQLFGDDWNHNNFYRRAEGFRNDMWWYGPSYGRFGRLYGNALCKLYFVRETCPVSYVESAN